MNSINEKNILDFEPNSILRSKFLKLPDGEKFETSRGLMYPTTSTAELQVRHHHDLSYVYSRKIATEVGDLLNNNLMDVVAMTNSNNGSNMNFENFSDVYSNSSVGNQSEHHDYLYRHSPVLTVVYCIAYFLVFAIGLVGNCLVVAVVFRAPRMRTVTNLFIVNLAIADILVVVLCIPATLLANIFVRKY